MSPRDSYTSFVNNPVGSRLAKTLGLPKPAPLKRYSPGQPLVTGPVLVLGESSASHATAKFLFESGVDVRRDVGVKERFAAVILGLDEAGTPADLSEQVLLLGRVLRRLRSSGRVITIGRDPEDPRVVDAPAVRSARQGITGLTRSIAQEMRQGATANGIQLADEVTADSPSALGALRYLLSARSAYVSGQFIAVSADAGETAQDPDAPLQGKVAVVTGAARGIGESIISTLQRDGATVVGVDVPAAGEQLSSVVNRLGGTALQLDITAADAGQRIIDHCAERYGHLDIVVHNAGITRDKLLANMNEAQWNSVIAVNIESQLRMNETFLAARGSAVASNLRLASLASTSGIAGNRGQTNYATSKSAVMGMTAATAPRLAETGGSINAVAPGFIETEMTAKMPAATREVARRLNSLRQGGLPEDVAETISYLVSDEAAGVNGQTLRVCGQAMMGA